MSIQATELVEHGIMADESDYRLHICFAAGVAYIYDTKQVKLWLQDHAHEYDEQTPTQPGVEGVTAKGYRIPHQDLPDCRLIYIPANWVEHVDCQPSDAPSEKKRKAELIATWLFDGHAPLSMRVDTVEDRRLQLKGHDLHLRIKQPVVIQVKCDYHGDRLGLFIQTHECNPLGAH